MSRHERQIFLGPDSELILKSAIVGIVGLGGGGSHVVQQFAHIGIGRFLPTDFDRIEDSNTTRLVGGTLEDVENEEWKTEISRRTVHGINPDAIVIQIRDKWQNATDKLKKCNLIIGAVDTFKERDQLERFCRKHLISYIDIGMDVNEVEGYGHLISGQVILSTPGNPCLRCCGLITDEKLEQEARKYGDTGGRPQVVWPNGVLASTAVGLAIQQLTPWFSNPSDFTYLEYDGNCGTLTPNSEVERLMRCECKHHPSDETGDPFFDIREHLKLPDKELESGPSVVVRHRNLLTLAIDFLRKLKSK